ncbi:MAG: glycoside hydrolase family 27 protein, partial [Bacteroidota bacterium]|nr:glycoside hydrolase family 27 protein [Bacteroidota bacterium]
PGSYGHEEQDARNYAAWGIDYLKYDACGEKEKHSDKELFAKMSTALKATGRPILFNLCIFYSKDTHTWGAALGNAWRTGEDIVQFIEKNPKVSWQNWNKTLHTQVLGKEAYAGPGHWNDPDNLIVGYARNNEQSIEEQKAQFSFWALLAAPLFLGNDVRNMSPAIKTILSNKEVIAVNQDSLGKQGTRLKQEKDYELWAKELSGNAKAVVIFNTTDSSITVPVTRALTGATAKDAVVRDLWQHRRLKIGKKSMNVQLQPHAVVMYKVYVP